MNESLLKNTGSKVFLLTLSKIITLLLTVVTARLLSGFLSLGEYGTYSELLTISSLAVSIFSIGIPSSLNYYLPQCENKEEKIKFLNIYFLFVTLISLLIIVILLFTKGIIADFYKNPSLLKYSLALLIIPWTKLIISSRSNMLVAEGKLKKEFIYCVLNAVALMLISIFIVVFKSNFELYLLLYVIVEIIFTLLVYFEGFILVDYKIKLKIDWNLIKTIVIFSIPLGLSTAISTISLDLDKLIIGFFMNDESVAIYANAGKELPFSIISSSFTAVLLPQIVVMIKDNNLDLALNKWKNQMEMCFIILVFCSIACIIFAPQIITILYSEKYLDGVLVFRIYSLMLIFRITYWGMLLNGIGKSKIIFMNSIICLIINIITSMILYKIIGFVGPAIGSLIGVISMSILNILFTCKFFSIKISMVIPYKNLILPLIVSGITGLIVYYLNKFLCDKIEINKMVIAISIGFLWMIMYFSVFLKRCVKIWTNMKK